MKISLPKSEIENFLSLSSFINITPETVIFNPISEYIQITIKKGFCKMILSSMDTFINNTFSTDQSDITLLVSYFELRDFYKSKRSEILVINDTEKKVTLSDGVFSSSYSKNTTLTEFPKQPSLSGLNFRRIGKEIIDILQISKKYIKQESKDKLIPFLNNSNIDGDRMLASDAFISFYHKLGESFPFTFFSKKEIDLISNFDYFDHILLDNWNIIKYKTIVFGKRLSEGIVPILYPQVENYISILKRDSVIKIPVEPFFNFCKSVIDRAKDATVNSILSVVRSGINGCVLLSYKDIQNNKECEQTINCEVIGFEEGFYFYFIQSAIIKVLDSLNSSLINISECVEENGRKGYIGFWFDGNDNFYSICSKGLDPANI